MAAVIVTLPHEIARGTELCVVTTDDPGAVAVMVRAASHHAWVPIEHIDGRVEVRAS